MIKFLKPKDIQGILWKDKQKQKTFSPPPPHICRGSQAFSPVFSPLIGNHRGFSLTGVLTSAAVGLVVVSGISQMFVNMAGQIRSIEQRTATKQFHSTLGTHISQPGICVNTLQDYGKWIHKGNPKNFSFSKILDQKGQSIRSLDLSLADNQKAQKQIYGMDGHVSYQLSCLGKPDSNGNFDKDCDCRTATWDYSANGPCQKRWRFNLLFQTRQNGVLVYQRPFSYDIQVEYPKAPQTVQNGAGQDRAQANLSCNSQISPFVSEEGRVSDPHGGPGANVFAGHLAGVSNHSSTNGNVFVGYAAGWKNTTGRDNTFIGTASGMKNTTGLENTFIGEGAGGENLTGSFNTFLGFHAGIKNKASVNTFIGTKAEENNTTGWDNVFVGSFAGQHNTTGTTNTFIGKDAGLKNTTGKQNLFVGDSAGEYNTTGEYNTYIGTYAGDRNTGSNNIIIGYNAELTSNLSGNNIFVIGNIHADTDWITGTIGGSSLKVRGSETVNASSRTLKKDISSFFEFEKSLQDILNTPLFNYSYKEKALHPKKQRMGLIAEELPKHLQLPGENYPHPDWPSIYGTLWAGIKALNLKVQRLKKVFDNLKTEMEEKLSSLSSDNKNSLKKLESQNKALALQIKEMREHFKDSLSKQKQEIKNQQDQISALSSQLEKLKQESTN